jgi:phosphate transport system permease protein
MSGPLARQPGERGSWKDRFLERRHRATRLWTGIFFLALAVAILALAALLVTVIDQSFGLVAVENKVAPETLANKPLAELSSEELVQVLRDHLTRNRVRTIERDQGPLAEMSRPSLTAAVIENVVKPQVVESYRLIPSLLKRQEIEAEIVEAHPGAVIEFRAWLSPEFLIRPMSPRPELAGVRTALLGSLFLIAITIAFAFPIGVGTAIYLEEYADKKNPLNRVIQTNIDNLAGVPSIVYGILGLAIFVRALEPLTSGEIFGVPDSNGRTILAAGLTMALLVLPLLIINAQEAIRAVPGSLRQASYGLGATRWQTIWSHVLPYALPGILTGTILSISRAIGETAPLIVIGASTVIFSDPNGPFAKFTALPIQIFSWTTRPQAEFRNIAAAAILVLLCALLSLNTFAILLRNRYSRQ